MITYEIVLQTAVKVYDTENNSEDPFLYQPFHPDTGKFWANAEEAEAWVQDYIPRFEAARAADAEAQRVADEEAQRIIDEEANNRQV